MHLPTNWPSPPSTDSNNHEYPGFLPDGSARELAAGSSSLDLAKNISEGLARVVLAAEVNGEVWDLSRALPDQAKVKLLKWEDDAGKNAFWHSSAHLLAEALEALYPGIKFGIGPPIENGFITISISQVSHFPPSISRR